VVVSGEVETGPLYQPEATTPVSTAGSSSPTPGTPVAPASSAIAPAPSQSGDAVGANTANAADGAVNDSGIPSWVYLAIALVVIAAVALLVVIVRRSRAMRPQGGDPPPS